MRASSIGLLLACLIGSAWAQANNPADQAFQDAQVAIREGDFAGAEFWFREMRRSYPKDTRGGFGLFGALYSQRKYSEALTVARELKPLFEKAPETYLRIGFALAALEQLDEALTEFQTALRYSGSSELTGLIHLNIGDTYRRLDRLDDAIAAFRKQKELSGGASLQLALALSAKKDPEDMAEYRAVIKQVPTQPVALNNLAYGLLERDGNLDEALSLARRAVEAAPGIADMMDTLGWALFKKGMLRDAEATMIEALLYEGGNIPTLREHFAAVLDALGQWTPDRRALRELLDGGSSPSEVARMKILLGRVRVR